MTGGFPGLPVLSGKLRLGEISQAYIRPADVGQWKVLFCPGVLFRVADEEQGKMNGAVRQFFHAFGADRRGINPAGKLFPKPVDPGNVVVVLVGQKDVNQ